MLALPECAPVAPGAQQKVGRTDSSRKRAGDIFFTFQDSAAPVKGENARGRSRQMLRVWFRSAESARKSLAAAGFLPATARDAKGFGAHRHGENIADSDAPDKTEKSTALTKRRK
jgi:hypothetical protein